MYTHASICKNNKIKISKITKAERDNCIIVMVIGLSTKDYPRPTSFFCFSGKPKQGSKYTH
jgi:hypothetical protein